MLLQNHAAIDLTFSSQCEEYGAREQGQQQPCDPTNRGIRLLSPNYMIFKMKSRRAKDSTIIDMIMTTRISWARKEISISVESSLNVPEDRRVVGQLKMRLDPRGGHINTYIKSTLRVLL